MTRFHVQHKSAPKWTGRGHFVYWKCTSSPGSHPTENYSCRKDVWAGFVLWEAFFILFFLVLFTMCHVKNKSSPVASQNLNIVCNIISIQMQYSNQSQSLLTMCHLVRTLKRVLLNNCPFLIFFFFFPITLTRQWHGSTYNTNLCSAQMNWARTFCLLEVHLVPRLSSYWKLQLPQGLMGWSCALRGVLITWNRVTEVIRQISSISVCLLYLEKLSSKSWAPGRNPFMSTLTWYYLFSVLIRNPSEISSSLFITFWFCQYTLRSERVKHQ